MQTIAETWVQKGVQQGLQQGREEGKDEALRTTLSSLLVARFQIMPPSLAHKLRQIDTPETLSSLTVNILSIPSIEDFEALVDKTLAYRVQ